MHKRDIIVIGASSGGVIAIVLYPGLTCFRCHTGRAYTASSLLIAITENIESTIYNAIRNIDEHVMLLNQLGDFFAEQNKAIQAANYFRRAKEMDIRANALRTAILDGDNEKLNTAD